MTLTPEQNRRAKANAARRGVKRGAYDNMRAAGKPMAVTKRSLRSVYRAGKESVHATAEHTATASEHAARASESAANSAQKVEALIPTKRQAVTAAAGATGLVAASAGGGSYLGARKRHQESMQTVGKRAAWKTIDDFERDERSGKHRMKSSSGGLAIGATLAGLGAKLGPGYPAAMSQTRLIRDATKAGYGSGGISGALGATHLTAVRNPGGAAMIGSALTLATAGAVYGTGAVQARNARAGVVARRKDNYLWRRSHRGQDQAGRPAGQSGAPHDA